jgi:hypothetical protein
VVCRHVSDRLGCAAGEKRLRNTAVSHQLALLWCELRAVFTCLGSAGRIATVYVLEASSLLTASFVGHISGRI